MTVLKYLLLATYLLLFSFVSFAASGLFTDKLDGQFDASRYLSENAYGFLPVPIIITDPAVEGGLGMMGLFFHETEEEQAARLAIMQDESNDKVGHNLLPPSVSAGFGAYTGNDSYFFGGGHLGFFNKGRLRYIGGAGYGEVNIDFYGFGNITLNKPLEIKTQASAIMQTAKFKIASSNFYLGPTHRYIDAEISPTNTNNLLENLPTDWQDPLVTLLTQDITTSGIGLTLEYDSRNSFFSPTSGIKYDLTHLWFNEVIGSDVDYQLTELTALHYLNLSKSWRTAFRIEANYANSDNLLPPYATPSISLRGIASARYQGQSVAMTELELAYRINLRWEVSAFAGIGKATNDYSEFSKSPSRKTQGLGFRYLIARRYDFNMGIDIAKGPEDNVFYIQAGSAW